MHTTPLLATLVLALLESAAILTATPAKPAAPIDRRALVTRHNVLITKPNPQTPLQVGNGEFAFSADVSGLQTFQPCCTLSQWAWHTSPLPPGMHVEGFKWTDWDCYGRKVPYETDSADQKELTEWLFGNPHRLNLARLRLRLTRADGSAVILRDLKNIRQQLDLWRGLLVSRYEVEGQPVEVQVCCHPTRDALAVRIVSPLAAAHRLGVVIEFPYADTKFFSNDVADWTKADTHTTTMNRTGKRRVDFVRELDADGYATGLAWQGNVELKPEKKHSFLLTPAADSAILEFTCAFSPLPDARALPDFTTVRRASEKYWKDFWSHGGAIDLSGSTDPRAQELERRIVLSQYLLAIQEAGSLPPQESGLVNNGWYGKFHLEMHWWHGTHYALWDRWPLFERSLGFYQRIMPVARATAQRQGYQGVRWPKMVGPEGRESPNIINPMLIWQQPHPISYAELDYRLHPRRQTLEKWKDIVFNTADFMASYPVYDSAGQRFVLGPPLRTVPEHTEPTNVINPTFELSYWRFGLRTAQQWRERLSMGRDAGWDRVLKSLSLLPVQDGVYLMEERLPATYTQENWNHPSLIGAYGMLPGDGVNPQIMHRTVKKVMDCWNWNRTWGWDYPMLAMAAARVGEPEMAIAALMNPSKNNQFQLNGFATGGPYPYFPNNGGLLYATAMMAAGWDGAPKRPTPGFPDDGKWVVKWEGLHAAQ